MEIIYACIMYQKKKKNLFFSQKNFSNYIKAGTGSTLTSAIRTGNASSFFGLVDHGKKKIERFFVSTFDDSIK